MNDRQRNRIKDTAFMVRNVLTMSDNMSKINIAYEKDLESFVRKLKQKEEGAQAPESNSGQKQESLVLANPDTNKNQNSAYDTEDADENKHSTSNNARRPPKKTKPPKPWVKDLYRKIMMKCHPDRNQNQNIEPLEQVYRAEALAIAVDAYQGNDYDELIYAGAIVGVFSDRLSANKQIGILNKVYAEKSEVISRIQSTIAWCWGVNWDTVEARIRVVQQVCNLNGIAIPSRENLILLLTEHEIK